jgi:4-methyl-5(b-hydroxyethyl)-thiazole monophosphate biosynthesis
MIYVLFAHGFEEIEAIAPVDMLRRMELDVKTVGVGSKTITGAHGITVHCDMIDHMATPKNMEMLVLPGGAKGAENLEKSEAVRGLINYAFDNDIWIGAICAAPSILGHMGLLEGKKTTCFPGWDDQLTGATYTGERVEQDGKLITAKGAGVSVLFGGKLVECLCGAEKATELVAKMQ